MIKMGEGTFVLVNVVIIYIYCICNTNKAKLLKYFLFKKVEIL